jgi:hypothetical protein
MDALRAQDKGHFTRSLRPPLLANDLLAKQQLKSRERRSIDSSQWQRTVDLPDVDGALHNKCSLISTPHTKHHRCAAGGCVAPANKARQSAGVNAFQATGGRAREELRHRSERSG